MDDRERRERKAVMTDYVIIGVLTVIVILAVAATIKHFRGESSCCGGDTYKARSKKLRTVIEKKTFRVEGMHCQNCVNRVMEAVQSVEGTSAVVHLKKGEVVVSEETPIADTRIREVIEEEGYTVTGIC